MNATKKAIQLFFILSLMSGGLCSLQSFDDIIDKKSKEEGDKKDDIDKGTSQKVAVNLVEITDDIFRAYLKRRIPDAFPNAGDKMDANSMYVKSLGVIDVGRNGVSGIRSLKGIEYFTGLTELDCSYNNLTNLNLKYNTALTKLYCNRNKQLTSLNLENNIALTYLDFSESGLISLNLKYNTALTYLDCCGNKLTSLNLENNTALTYFCCFSNELTSLNLENNTALTYLNCGHNKLTSLNLENNTALNHLDCCSNKLTSLNLENNTALTHLDCCHNKLTSLDLTHNCGLYISSITPQIERSSVVVTRCR